MLVGVLISIDLVKVVTVVEALAISYSPPFYVCEDSAVGHI